MRIPLRKFRPQNLFDTVRIMFSDKIIVARWASSKHGTQNFGDILNSHLIKIISERSVVNLDDVFLLDNRPVYSVIGSTLNNLNFDNAVVWGSGFMYDTGKLKKAPREVRAVRGPMSRNVYLKLDIPCPPVYGDPALLCPIYYNKQISKIFDIGIVPHYVDTANPNLGYLLDSGLNCKIIDVTSGVENVINDIRSCRHIASSSLHGLVVADAYGIPTSWIKFGDKIKGGDFKFQDYYLSIGESDISSFKIDQVFSRDKFWDSFSKKKMDIDLDKLLSVCPFKS